MLYDKYKPDSIDEADHFYETWCDNCIHDKAYRESERGEDGCPIIAKAFAYPITDDEYPRELVFKDNMPVCTSFSDEEKPYRCDKTIDMFGGE